MTITHAMVLAAGRGQRLRPITDTLPKPLVSVAGVPLIDRILDRLSDAGVREAVVNLHHHGERLANHLSARKSPRIVFSREPTLLETGGGVRQALGMLGGGPFFVVNGDVLWRDGKRAALDRLAKAWDEASMDVLLLLQRTVTAIGYDGVGDFMATPTGAVRRPAFGEIAPYLYAGIHIIHPRLFAAAPEGAFSLNRLFDEAAARERLAGIVHDGEWYHVGTPEALLETEEQLSSTSVWR